MLIFFSIYTVNGKAPPEERVDQDLCLGFTFFYVPFMGIVGIVTLYQTLKEDEKKKEERG